LSSRPLSLRKQLQVCGFIFSRFLPVYILKVYIFGPWPIIRSGCDSVCYAYDIHQVPTTASRASTSTTFAPRPARTFCFRATSCDRDTNAAYTHDAIQFHFFAVTWRPTTPTTPFSAVGWLSVCFTTRQKKDSAKCVLHSSTFFLHLPHDDYLPTLSSIITSQVIQALYDYIDERTGRSACLIRPVSFSSSSAIALSPPNTHFISEETYGIVMANAARLDAAIVHSRDNAFDYFGFRTLERSYLLRIEGLIVERPQVTYFIIQIFCFLILTVISTS
jgi:hypothetical protein